MPQFEKPSQGSYEQAPLAERREAGWLQADRPLSQEGVRSEREQSRQERLRRYKKRLAVVGTFAYRGYEPFLLGIAQNTSDVLFSDEKKGVMRESRAVGVRTFIPVTLGTSETDVTASDTTRQAIESSNLLIYAIAQHYDITTFHLGPMRILADAGNSGITPANAYTAIDATIIEFEERLEKLKKSPRQASESNQPGLVIVMNHWVAGRVFEGITPGNVQLGRVGVFQETRNEPHMNLWKAAVA